MAKRKTHSKSKKQKKQIIEAKPKNLSWDADVFYAENNLSKLRIIRVTTLILGGIGSVYLLIYRQERKVFFASIPQGWYYLLTLLLIISIYFRISLTNTRNRNAARMMADGEYGRKIIIAQTVNQIIFLGLIAVPIIYISGLTNSVAEYLHFIYPTIEVNVGNALLSILSYVVSGVIGNAAYDLLKAMFSKRKTGNLIKQKGLKK